MAATRSKQRQNQATSKRAPKQGERTKEAVTRGFDKAGKEPDETVYDEQQRKQSRHISRKSRVNPPTKATSSGRGANRKSNKSRSKQRKAGG